MATDAALFLDFDGTLVPLAASPGAVRVDDGLRAMLTRVHAALGGALAIVSGRDCATLDAMLQLQGLAIAGSHGLEIKAPDGHIHAVPPPPGLADARARMADFATRHPGVEYEDKAHGAALHWRGAPEAEAAATALAAELATDGELHVQHGKCVVELRSGAGDKGRAIRQLMASPPFKGRKPVFVGDDVTDEAGFRAARALGGRAIRVADCALTDTAAAECLPDVLAVRMWLSESPR